MGRYRKLLPVLVALLFFIPRLALAQTLEDPIAAPVLETQEESQSWNLEILTFHDYNWNGEPDEGEEYVHASGIVTYEGEQVSWSNEESRALIEVPRGVQLSITNIEESNEVYSCWHVTYTLPSEGRWVVYVPCHIRVYMLLPWALNWG